LVDANSAFWSTGTSSNAAADVQVTTVASTTLGVDDFVVRLNGVDGWVTTWDTETNLIAEEVCVESAVGTLAEAWVRGCTAGVTTSACTNLDALATEAVVTGNTVVVAVRTGVAGDTCATFGDGTVRYASGACKEGLCARYELRALLSGITASLSNRVTSSFAAAVAIASAAVWVEDNGTVTAVIVATAATSAKGQCTKCCKN
jgi:hypothetical protein